MLAAHTKQHDTDYHWKDDDNEDEYTITNEQRLAQLELDALAISRTAELSKPHSFNHCPDSGVERLRFVNEALRNDPTPIESDRIRRVVFRDQNLAEIRYVEPLVYDTDTDDDGYEDAQDVVYDSDLEDIEQEYEKLQITEITTIPYDGDQESKHTDTPESPPTLPPSSTTMASSSETDSASDSSTTTDSGVGKSDIEIVEVTEPVPSQEPHPPDKSSKDVDTNTISFKADCVNVVHKELVPREEDKYVQHEDEEEEEETPRLDDLVETETRTSPTAVTISPVHDVSSGSESSVSSESDSEDTRVEFKKSSDTQARQSSGSDVEDENEGDVTEYSVTSKEQSNSINSIAKEGWREEGDKSGATVKKKKSRIPTRRKVRNSPLQAAMKEARTVGVTNSRPTTAAARRPVGSHSRTGTPLSRPRPATVGGSKRLALGPPSLVVSRSKGGSPRSNQPASPSPRTMARVSPSPRTMTRASPSKSQGLQKTPSPLRKKPSSFNRKTKSIESNERTGNEAQSSAEKLSLKATRTPSSPKTRGEKTFTSPRKRKSTLSKRPQTTLVSINTDQSFRSSVQLVQLDGNLRAKTSAKSFPRGAGAEPFLWQFSRLPAYNGTTSKYGLTEEQYELKRKQQQELKQKREDMKRKKKEDEEEKKKRNEEVFQAWLKQKQQGTSTKQSLPLAQEILERRKKSEEAYLIWLKKKREEKRLEQRIQELRKKEIKRINPTTFLHRNYGSSPNLSSRGQDRLTERNVRTLPPSHLSATMANFFGMTF